MERLTTDNVESLFDERDGWCVSLYLPTHRAGKEIREDPIRLKNRLTDAANQLEKADVPGGRITRMLEPAQQLCDLDSDENRQFWGHQADGLALFLSADGMETYRLPGSFEELTVVARRFHVKPLLRAVQQDEQYCLLAVSQNEVRFLEGSCTGLSARPIEDLPESLQAVVRGDHHKGFGLHSFRVRANSGDAAVPHGHVESNEQHELDRYFRLIDQALADALKDDTRPLVFAGVDELFAHFKKANTYKNIIDEAVTGNPDDLADDELHKRAWSLVSKRFEARQAEVIDRWKAAEHTDLGDTALEKILPAAHDGRIETLLLAAEEHRWGTYDPDARKVTIDGESTAHNYDLLDLAAVRALTSDARVLIVDDGPALGDNGVAAIYRYAAT